MSRKILTDLDFQSASRIRNLPAAVNPDEPVRLSEMLAIQEGMSWKDNARVAASTNVNLASPGASLDGVSLATGDRFLAYGQTSQPENGIYVWNGAAVPATRALDASTFEELESAFVAIDEGTSAGSVFRQTQVNGVIGTNNIIWTSAFQSSGPASETSAGIAEIATQTETDTGTDDARIVTPLKLANWPGRRRKASANIGDGTATQFDLSHNFSTREVLVNVYRNSTPWDTVETDIERPNADTIRLRFVSPPTTNAYTVVVIG